MDSLKTVRPNIIFCFLIKNIYTNKKHIGMNDFK